MAETLYTPEEIAARLNLKLRTVWKWLKAGKLKGVKMGREWRIPDSDLQAFIDGLKAARDSKPE
jgi:excisionase family DNA binding protein